MIDFVKILVEHYDGSLLKDNPLLSFHRVISEDAEDDSNFSTAFYKDLKFIVFDNGTTLIQGSLHKFYNEGMHNHNDFTYSRLQQTLHEISESFGIELRRCKLQNLEVGLNIEPCINTEDILDNLILHKGEKFKDKFVDNGNYRQVKHTSYYLKAYDKALQHNLSQRIFRWEIKMMRGELIRKLGIINLQNLLNKRILEQYLTYLIKKWEETLVLDTTIKLNKLNAYDFIKIHNWRYKDYWINLKKNNTKSKRHYFTKEVKKYKNVVENHSDNIQDNITNILKNKMKYCLNN